MVKQRILIVEDDKNISKLVRYNLEKAGFECAAAGNGEDALNILEKKPADLVVLDIMLPCMDGFEVAREIKKDTALSGVPIIMLTARGEEMDRVVGLELGADDYMVKPFSPRELILRIKAVLKRSRPEEADRDILTAGKITADISRHRVTVDKKEITFTLIEFNLLVTLMKRAGRVQSRERLLEDVWGIASDVTTRTVDTHVKCLRQKLGRSGRLIETVRGIGYRFSESA